MRSVVDDKFRAVRIRKETFDRMKALQQTLIRRGLRSVPQTMLPQEHPDASDLITMSFVLDVAMNALDQALEKA